MTWSACVVEGLERVAAELRSCGAPMERAGADPRGSGSRGGILYEFRPLADDAFDVSCRVSEQHAQVSFGGWHESFTSHEPPAQIVKLVAFGLSNRCKLEVRRASNRECRWRVWTYDAGIWRLHSETGLFLFPWWGRRSTLELRNDVLPWDEGLWGPGADVGGMFRT